jgi:hypothetical protein
MRYREQNKITNKHQQFLPLQLRHLFLIVTLDKFIHNGASNPTGEYKLLPLEYVGSISLLLPMMVQLHWIVTCLLLVDILLGILMNEAIHNHKHGSS